jgi:hypothetical protein
MRRGDFAPAGIGGIYTTARQYNIVIIRLQD